MRAHAQSKETSTDETGTNQDAMDCEHHHHGNGNQQQGMNCAMSCCHDGGLSLMAALFFVLPQPAVLSQPAKTLSAIGARSPDMIASVFEPPSPPPRVGSSLS
jgi:hypothetical protein